LSSTFEINYHTKKEELANAISSGVGTLLSIIAAFVLINSLIFHNSDLTRFITVIVFSVTLFLMYVSSTLYHASSSVERKHRFLVLDHICLYLFIAGTYTPFTLVNIPGTLGWSLFIIVWILAAFGISWKLFFKGLQHENISDICYIVMAGLWLVALKPILEIAPMPAILWFLAGDFMYVIGVVFYRLGKVPYNHAIWHLFVIAGSTFHFFAVLLHVVPVKG